MSGPRTPVRAAAGRTAGRPRDPDGRADRLGREGRPRRRPWAASGHTKPLGAPVLAALLAAAPMPATAQELVPPRLRSEASVTVRGIAEPREVLLALEVDERGRVTDVQLVEPSPHAAPAVEAARALRFEPARRDGQPIAARVRLRLRLKPPPRDGVVEGTVIDRVSRAPIAAARVEAAGRGRSVLADSSGRFRLPVAPGSVLLRIEAAGYQMLETTETVSAGSAIDVRYAMTPEGQSRYETVVTSTPIREEVSRRRLTREEVTQTPGTMGDPFRVIDTLPGVVPLVTGVPYYYIRGAPPADTGFFVDGVRVPALFHLALGPSVVHPNLVEQVDFFAGGAPARYPGYVGGIVGATTAPLPSDRLHLDVDARLIDLGAIASVPFGRGRTRASVSGRYSYTAWLLSALQEDVFIDYWDYQVRLEHDVTASQSATLFAFGSYDALGEIDETYDDYGNVVGHERETQFAQAFHRADGRYRWKLGAGRWLELAVTGGIEEALIGEGELATREASAGPRATLGLPVGDDVRLRIGADASYQHSWFTFEGGEHHEEDEEDDIGDLLPSRDLSSGGAFAELVFRADRDTTVIPAARVAGWIADDMLLSALDPRLAFRRDLRPGVALKGSIGLYHQPPAFVIPLPGLGSVDFDRGLQRAVQASHGIELEPGWGLQIDAQLFYHRYENLSDLVLDDESSDGDDFPRMTGSGYGLELIVRRPLTSRLFGWIGYTLSRSEREVPSRPVPGDCSGRGTIVEPATIAPSDADRTHVLNVVASYELPAHFRVGARLHFRSGRPFTRKVCSSYYADMTYGVLTERRNAERMPAFLRLDLRIDKRWTYASWKFELYFELINATFAKEVLEMEQEERSDGTYSEPRVPDDLVPIVLPTFGVRGVF